MDFLTELERRRRLQTGGAVLGAVGVPAERAATAKRVADALGITPEMVLADPTTEHEARAQQILGVLDTAPATRQFLSNPVNAAVAHDQTESLSIIERALQGGSDILRSFASGPVQLGGQGVGGWGDALQGIERTIGRITGQQYTEPDRAMQAQSEARGSGNGMGGLAAPSAGGMAPALAILADPRKVLRSTGRGMSLVGEGGDTVSARIAPPAERQNFATGVSQAVGQIGGQALLMRMNPLLAESLFTGMGVEQMADTARADGQYGTVQGDAVMAGGGIVTGLSERLAIDALLERIPPALKSRLLRKVADLGIAGLVEGTQEIVEGVSQNAMEKALLDPNASLTDGLVEQGAQAGSAAVIVRAVLGAITPGRTYRARGDQAELAKVSGEQFDGLVQSIITNPLTERSPEQMQGFLQGIMPGEVHIPAEAVAAFFQAKRFDDVGAVLQEWGIADQMDEALAAKADVVVDAATYAVKIAPMAHDAFREDIRLGSGAMSLREAAEFDAGHDAGLDEAAQQVVDQALADQAAAEPASKVFQSVYEQATNAGYTPDVARQYAALWSSRYEARAARSPDLYGNALDAFNASKVAVRQDLPADLKARIDKIDVVINALRARTKPKADESMFGPSLLTFVSKGGGIVDAGGELAAMDVGQWHKGKVARRKLVRTPKDAADAVNYGAERVAERAFDAGYIAEPTQEALLAAMQQELAGKTVFPADARANVSGAREEFGNALDQLDELLARLGLSVDTATNAEIKAAIDAYQAQDQFPGDRSFNQPRPDDAAVRAFGEQLQAKYGMRGVELHLQRGDLKVAHIAAPKGERGQGKGSAVMQEIVDYADQHGLRMVLTPGSRDDGFGTTSRARLIAFYKRFGFVENKGRAKDFALSDGMYRDPAPRSFNQSSGAPIFYSALSRAVEASPTKSAPAAQWLATLSKTPGVKQEEIEWTGVREWLGLQEGNVTRQALSDYLSANGMQIEEVLQEVLKINQGSQYLFPAVEEAIAGARSRDDMILQLENDSAAYRVLSKQDDLRDDQGDLVENWAEVVVDDLLSIRGDQPARATQFGDYKLPGADETYKELLLTLPQIGGPSTHWDVSNVVAHARITERKSVEGKRVLFLEEVQSDWHQKGRDQGYQGSASTEEIDAAETVLREVVSVRDDLKDTYISAVKKAINDRADELERLAREHFFKENGRFPVEGEEHTMTKQAAAMRSRLGVGLTVSSAGMLISSYGVEYTPAMGETFKRYNSAQLRVQEQMQAVDALRGSIPDAPFRKTWSALVMKRMIRYAVDNGFEQVAWINGNQQNGGTTGGDGAFFYERNLVNVTNDLLKKAGAKVEKIDFRNPAAVARVVKATEGPALAAARESSLGSLNSPTTALGMQNGFTITPELASAASGGMSLFQPADGSTFAGPRGRIDLFADGSRVINLFESRNLSTLLHEGGHLWLEELRQDAAAGSASAVAELDIINAWFTRNGLTDPTDQHEAWARATESYLMEGKAPSAGLRAAFARFKSWLISIYRTVNALNTPIDDEIRGVMDRLIATDEEIAAARASTVSEPMFTDAKAAGMTDAEFGAYSKTVARSREASHDALLAKVMGAIKRQRTAEWKAEAEDLRPEAAATIDAMPEMKALNWLRANKAALAREAVIDLLGDESALAMLPKSVPPLVVERGGIHPDNLAEASGYRTGEEMLRGLMAVEAERQAMRGGKDKRSVRAARIDAEVARIQSERHGDPFTDGSIEREALDAIHNERQGELLAAELRALGRKTGNRPTPLQALREWARANIAGKRLRDATRTDRYLRAERKAANAAIEAAAKGDNETAVREKQAQLLNHLLYAEARKASDMAEKAIKLFTRYAKARTIKGMDQEYLEQIHALLERFDFAPTTLRSADRRAAFAEWVRAKQAAGEDVAVSDELLAGVGRTPYVNMTVEEMGGLYDAVRSIAHLGRLKQTLLDNRDKRDFEAVIDEALTQGGRLKTVRDLSVANPKKNWTAAGDAALLKVETWADWLDDGDVNGVFNRLLIRPATDAANREGQLREEISGKIGALREAVPEAQRKAWQNAWASPMLLEPRTGEPLKFQRGDLIAMALNIGNESNLDKLARGYDWAPETIELVLNKELTAEEWTFVQGVWDTLEGLWPDIAATERKLSGVEPERVVPREVVTPHGTLAGGYYPAVYDYERSADAAKWAAKEAADMFGGVFYTAGTPKGHTKTRTAYAAPISLSVNRVLNGHVNKVIKRIAYGEFVTSARKFIVDRRIMQLIQAKLGQEYYDQLMPWLQRQVRDQASSSKELAFWEGFARRARINFQMVAMGFRVTTFVAQTAGLTSSASAIGLKWLGKGTTETLRLGVKGASEFVFSRSPEMEQRGRELDRDLRDAMADFKDGEGMMDPIRRWAFVLIGVTDRYVVALPTWLGAYHKAAAEGLSEDDAIASADKAVRTSQGSGRAKDLAAVQAPNSEFMKLFTLFYSYFNVQYQRQRDAGRAAAEGDIAKAVAISFWMLIAAPLAASLVTGDFPDDEEGWMKWALSKVFFNLWGGIPVIRDAAAYGERAVRGKYSEYAVSPLNRVGGSVVDLLGDVVKLVKDGEPGDRWIKHAIETPGYFVGLPTGQIGNTVQYISDLIDGDQEPENVAEFLTGMIKGPQKDQ